MFRLTLVPVSILFFLLAPGSALAMPQVESVTGLQVDAPKNYSIQYDGTGTYTIKKKRTKAKATLILGKSPFGAKQTADDYIASSNYKVKKYNQTGDSVLLNGKLGKKKLDVRFRETGGLIEVSTFSGKDKVKKKKGKTKAKKNKKKKGKKKKKNRRSSGSLRLTAGAIAAFDRIIRSRQGGIVVPLPVTIPTRRLVGGDGTSALVPNLPGWSFDARDGIISGGNPTQGIVNLGIPTLVLFPGTFFTQGVINRGVDPQTAIAEVWPKQVAFVGGGAVRVLAIQQVPGTAGWLGQNFSSALFAVRFAFNNRTWQALFVSGSAPFDGVSWFWYHSYIAVPEGSSPAIGNALMNTWATWDNTNANAARLQDALNTIATTPLPGNPIDPDVFDAIHQQWVDYIRQ